MIFEYFEYLHLFCQKECNNISLHKSRCEASSMSRSSLSWAAKRRVWDHSSPTLPCRNNSNDTARDTPALKGMSLLFISIYLLCSTRAMKPICDEKRLRVDTPENTVLFTWWIEKILHEYSLCEVKRIFKIFLSMKKLQTIWSRFEHISLSIKGWETQLLTTEWYSGCLRARDPGLNPCCRVENQ